MSNRIFFISNFGSIDSLIGASGEEALQRALEMTPRQAYRGDFLFVSHMGGRNTILSFGFPSVRFPELGDAVFVNYTDDSKEDTDEEEGWVIRHGDSDHYYAIQEDEYAHERNFIPEAVAIQALDYFLKTGNRDPSLPWEPYNYYDPVFGDFDDDNNEE